MSCLSKKILLIMLLIVYSLMGQVTDDTFLIIDAELTEIVGSSIIKVEDIEFDEYSKINLNQKSLMLKSTASHIEVADHEKSSCKSINSKKEEDCNEIYNDDVIVNNDTTEVKELLGLASIIIRGGSIESIGAIGDNEKYCNNCLEKTYHYYAGFGGLQHRKSRKSFKKEKEELNNELTNYIAKEKGQAALLRIAGIMENVTDFKRKNKNSSYIINDDIKGYTCQNSKSINNVIAKKCGENSERIKEIFTSLKIDVDNFEEGLSELYNKTLVIEKGGKNKCSVHRSEDLSRYIEYKNEKITKSFAEIVGKFLKTEKVDHNISPRENLLNWAKENGENEDRLSILMDFAMKSDPSYRMLFSTKENFQELVHAQKALNNVNTHEQIERVAGKNNESLAVMAVQRYIGMNDEKCQELYTELADAVCFSREDLEKFILTSLFIWHKKCAKSLVIKIILLKMLLWLVMFVIYKTK
jgi:hypothetical protein